MHSHQDDGNEKKVLLILRWFGLLSSHMHPQIQFGDEGKFLHFFTPHTYWY